MPQAIINSFFLKEVPAFPGPAATFHLDAYSIVGLNDNDPVATWSDISGNGRDFTQGTAGDRPVYRVNQQNGLPGVSFPSADSLITNLLPSGGQIFTIFAAHKFSVVGGDGWIFHWGTSTDGASFFKFTGDRGIQVRDAGSPTTSVDAASTGNAEYWSVRREATPQVALWVNGTSQAVTNDNGTMGNLTSAAILGAFNPASPTLHYSGVMFEIIGYASALSTSDRQGVEAYLASKWAI